MSSGGPKILYLRCQGGSNPVSHPRALMYLFGCRYTGFICIYLGAGTLGSYVFIWVQIRWVHMYLFGCRYAGFICIYLGADTLGLYVFIWVQVRWVHMYLFGCRYAGFICMYLRADTLGSYVFIWVQIRWVHMYVFGCRYAGFICIYLGAGTLGSYVNAPKQDRALEAPELKIFFTASNTSFNYSQPIRDCFLMFLPSEFDTSSGL